MQGFARTRPHGYAGDFEIIERIYNVLVSERANLKKWDLFFHAAPGADAVRNRGSVLVDICREEVPRSILSIGAGPGLDIRPLLFLEQAPERIVLLDSDGKALARARVNLSVSRSSHIQIESICRNALRWRDSSKFDLIWSSGIFDYLSDKNAIYLMKTLHDTLAQNGRLVVGNFSHDHAARAYMESVCHWFLLHRSPEDLIRLGQKAGFMTRNMRVISDASGVNLFLIAQR